MSTTPIPTAPLQDFRVVGVQENWYSAAPGHRQPGGSCWHCGTGIAVEVLARNTTTGEVVTIGSTCAERIGLDPAGLKRYLSERFAEQRAERSAAARKAQRAKHEAREAADAAAHGEHGTPGRYLAGCLCQPCMEAAPHGTFHRFTTGACRCLDCCDALVAARPYGVARPHEGYRYVQRTVLVDVETGEIIRDARRVETRYGYRWRSDARNVWLPVAPARRSTLASKGYVEAEAPYIVETSKGRQGWFDEPVCRVGLPVFDRWGEPIAHPAAA